MPRGSRPERGGALNHILPLLRPYRVQLALATAAMAADALFTALRPWPLKVVIDRVLSNRVSHVPFVGPWLDHVVLSKPAILYGACVATLLIAVSTGLFTYYFTRALGDVGQRFVASLRHELFAHMQRLSLRFHDRQRTGDLITRLTSDIQSIQDMISNGILIFGSNAFLIVGMLALMFWLNWQFALIALSVAPALFWTIFRSTQHVRTAARQARTSAGALASVAQESLNSIRIVQGLAQEDQQIERFQVQSVSNQRAFLESIRYQARVAPLVDVLSAVGLALVMWYGATRVLAGALTTGDVIVFFAYITNLYSPMRALARLAYTYNKAEVGLERIVEVLQIRSDVRDRADAQPLSGPIGSIVFKDVSFEYDSGHPVLSHIDLTIGRGEKVALVGATGAGKSTLASLVPRFYNPIDGSVIVGGRDIRDYTLQSLREQISLVLQDPLLFSGTVRENIAFGRPDATDDEIVAAAMTAHADEFIQRLPDGYDSLVAEAGTNLSGGQKQRIAIARAVVRNTPILIMDEPTSGLDAASERLVVDALARAASGRSTLIIAHRFTSVRFVDRIIVLEEGRIVEEGTHDQLIRHDGRYANLCRLQAGSEATHGAPASAPSAG